MCEPTTALLIASAGSSFLQYQQAKEAQKARFVAQKRQNEIARVNAIRRYATEQLKIRQAVAKSSEKGFQADIRSRVARAKFIAGSEGLALSGSQERLMGDYYRVQGNYNASLQRNLEAIQFGQEAQSTYLQPPNPALLFASSALNVANTYYSLEFQKENAGLMTNKQKNAQTNSVSGVWT